MVTNALTPCLLATRPPSTRPPVRKKLKYYPYVLNLSWKMILIHSNKYNEEWIFHIQRLGPVGVVIPHVP